MLHLLNLLAGVSLLVWGTHNVRTGILRIYGGDLRRLLRSSVSNRFTAVLAGLGVLVHAVRLNTLEFSTHKGLAWQGHNQYTPFARRREAA